MQFDSVQQLSAWLADTDIALLELNGPGLSLRLYKEGDPAAIEADPRAAPPRATPARPEGLTVRAPSVGVFLTTHPLHATPLALPGARVRAGEPIALMQIGALLLPVPAPQDAIVRAVLAVPGTLMGFGTALFELDPR
jgi:acetyl-CoA carboxylase biotin carboxyl carrier protein